MKQLNPHDEMAEHYREQAMLDLIRTLLERGIDPRTVESITNSTPAQVTHVLNVHFNGKIRVPEDDELVAEARRLAKKVLNRAGLLMDTAPLLVQVSLMKSVMPAIGRLIGNDAGSSFEEAYSALSSLLASQRVDPPSSPGVLSLSSGPATALIPTDDPNQGLNP